MTMLDTLIIISIYFCNLDQQTDLLPFGLLAVSLTVVNYQTINIIRNSELNLTSTQFMDFYIPNGQFSKIRYLYNDRFAS